jgi:polyisoprenoid-binding protein YceI
MNVMLVLVLAATMYRAEPVNGTVAFSIMKWGVIKEEGLFRDFRADIVFDEKNVAASRVEFDVEVASIDTKNDGRDRTLRSEDFFHARRYPRMTFRSTRVVPRGKDVADVTGNLTIRGVTRSVTVPVRLLGISKSDGHQRAGFETSFTIKRRAFGVTGGRWVAEFPGVLGEDVTVRIIAGGVSR